MAVQLWQRGDPTGSGGGLMPLYDFTCPKCGHKDYNMLVGSDFEYKCKCGTWMKREFPAPNVPPSGKYSFRMDRSDGNATKDE